MASDPVEVGSSGQAEGTSSSGEVAADSSSSGEMQPAVDPDPRCGECIEATNYGNDYVCAPEVDCGSVSFTVINLPPGVCPESSSGDSGDEDCLTLAEYNAEVISCALDLVERGEAGFVGFWDCEGCKDQMMEQYWLAGDGTALRLSQTWIDLAYSWAPVELLEIDDAAASGCMGQPTQEEQWGCFVAAMDTTILECAPGGSGSG